MTQKTFDACVQVLLRLADFFGTSYEAVNVWIFCVIWPLLTLALLAVVLRQRLRIRQLQTIAS